MIPFDVDFIRATGRRGLFLFYVLVYMLCFLDSWNQFQNCGYAFLFYFPFAALKRDKNDISGTGSLLYEHNAMILSGVIYDLVEPWTIHESKFKQRNKLNPTFNPTLELHVN